MKGRFSAPLPRLRGKVGFPTVPDPSDAEKGQARRPFKGFGMLIPFDLMAPRPEDSEPLSNDPGEPDSDEFDVVIVEDPNYPEIDDVG